MTDLIETQHLIDACGADLKKLAALAVLLSAAATAFTMMEPADGEHARVVGDQLREFRRANDDIHTRVKRLLGRRA